MRLFFAAWLKNTACISWPDGSPDLKITVKVYPTTDEQGFLASGNTADLPVYATPAGCLGIAICADSWYPGIYERFTAAGVEIVAVPSFLVPA